MISYAQNMKNALVIKNEVRLWSNRPCVKIDCKHSEGVQIMGKTFAENRKASFDYFIVDTLECGIELKGTEVKSICKSNVSIKEAWCDITNGELTVKGMHIAPFEHGNRYNVAEKRERKLLAHKVEIKRLLDDVKLKGMTLIPLKVYAADNHKIKVLLGLCKGKHTYDKRQSIKEKDVKRDMARQNH